MPRLESIYYPIITSALLFALMVGLMGAALDHHFPERQPGHTHLYLNAVSQNHVHPYEVPHGHPGDSLGGHFSGFSLGNSSTDGILYFAADGGLHSTFDSFISSPIHLSVVFDDLQGHEPLWGFSNNENVLPEAFIAPPKRPPTPKIL